MYWAFCYITDDLWLLSLIERRVLMPLNNMERREKSLIGTEGEVLR